MPVPQRVYFIVEQVGKPDARSTKSEFSCGTGKMPVPKQVIENSAISQVKLD